MDEARIEFLKKDYVQGFPAFCGIEVTHVDYGVFETRLTVGSKHTQQDGFVHAGALATMADHTAGYAAYTTVGEAFRILTVEYKINFLRPASGEYMTCFSKVISNGRKIKVAESEIFSTSAGRKKCVAKAIVTLMAVHESELAG
jgi:uncharacterized protein (TIGR00369 family)